MACLRCRSDWVTLKGKDMVSCPECCKQQRCKARKQGRLAAEESKRCERCGGEFVASGGNAIRQARHCSACREAARDEYLQARKDKIKSGEWQPKPQRKMKGRKCLRCGTPLKKNQRKYCGRKCFNAAKKEGIQSWDRTRQLESIWHRGGRWACAPSRKPVAEMRGNMHAFLRKVGRVHSFLRNAGRATAAFLSLRQSVCEVCGGFNEKPSSRFCSNECASRHVSERSCKHCGVRFISVGAYGAASRVCNACKKRARQEESRRYKRKYGRNHRQRARHHGVEYVSFPVREIYERDGYKCQICSKRVFEKARYRKSDGKIHPLSPTIDHIVPMSKGGNHEPDNCQTACFACNSRKSDSGGGQLRLAIAAAPNPPE